MNKVLWSKKSDHWSTPDAFTKSLGNYFDPCPLGGSGIVEPEKWKGRVFINPPYSDIRTWIDYALKGVNAKEIIMLLPARTDTKWFHELILTNASEIQFLKGRLKFGGSKNSAPFPSMVIYFRR